MDDLYLVLGVEQDAKPEEIRERFRFLAQAYHPDKFSSPAQKLLAEEEFKRINNAYQILSNPRKRSDYNLRRKSTTNYSRTNSYDVNRKTEEAARQRAQEEQKRRAEETARQRAQEEQKRKVEEAARQYVQEEQKRKAEETARQRAQEEQKRKAEEAARQRTQEEAENRAEEDAPQQIAWENKRKGNTKTRSRVWSAIALILFIIFITGSFSLIKIPTPFLVDDFSDKKNYNNWRFVGDIDNSKQVDISNGELIIKVSNDTNILYIPANYSDVIIQVDITKNSGNGLAGLVCRMEEVYGEYLSLYYFGIYENNIIVNDFYKNDVGSTLIEGGQLYDYLDFSYSENPTYTLTVECLGNKFSAYVNGKLVAYMEVKNQLLSSGYVGVIVVDTKESDISF